MPHRKTPPGLESRAGPVHGLLTEGAVEVHEHVEAADDIEIANITVANRAAPEG